MSEHQPSEEVVGGEILEDSSRRDFLRTTIGLGVGAVVGATAPAESEAGVLGSAMKVGAARAALKSAEKRLMSEEDKAKLLELEKAEETAGKECNAEFNVYMKQNPGKTDADFLKTPKGIDCYAKWTNAKRDLINFKK